MEEINRVGLQFVCFDILGAHGGISSLPNVEELKPKGGETLNVKGLVDRLKKEPVSFLVDMTDLPLEKQQTLISEYCEQLLSAKLGKGIMTIIEECQDFVPQSGKPTSFDAIVRLCKLGKAERLRCLPNLPKSRFGVQRGTFPMFYLYDS